MTDRPALADVWTATGGDGGFDVWLAGGPRPADGEQGDDAPCQCVNCDGERTVAEHREAAPDTDDPEVIEVTFKANDQRAGTG